MQDPLPRTRRRRRKVRNKFEDCSFHSSCLSRKCRRLRMCAVPCAARMVYDLGVLVLFVTLARSHVFRVGFFTRTVCCGDRGASSLAVRAWYDLYPSGHCCRNAFTFFRFPLRSSHEVACCDRLGCLEAQHRQVSVATTFCRLCEKIFHCPHCSIYESIRLRIQWFYCNVIEPLSGVWQQLR